MPAEMLRCLTRIGDKDRRIAGPSCGLLSRDRVTTYRFGRSDNLAHRVTVSRAKIQRGALAAGSEMIERAQMSFSEILDVNVVADGGSIGGRVVRPVDVNVRALSECGLQYQRDEMRFGLV